MLILILAWQITEWNVRQPQEGDMAISLSAGKGTDISKPGYSFDKLNVS